MLGTRLTIPVILTLVAALAVGAIVPPVGVCAVTAGKCGTEQCCGACCASGSDEVPSCCSDSTPARVCRCGSNEPPVAPERTRNTDERSDLFRVEAAMLAWYDGELLRTARPGDAVSLSLLTPLSTQAILCRWLN